jgi:UDP-3-O-[3-hydroxymyristoyl] glucosamine N-acyltransferase
MEFTSVEIADILKGTVEGDHKAVVSELSKIEEGRPGTLSFLANPKYESFIYTTKATIVIVSDSFKPEKSLPQNLTLIKVADAYKSFAQLLDFYNHLKNDKTGVEKPSFISEDAKLGKAVYIGAFTYIGKGSEIASGVKIYPNTYIGDNVFIDQDTIIYAGCKIYTDTIIGKKCVIHAGVVLGADGFGFAANTENQYNKIAQIGNVVIEDYVEIGANACIDRATLGSTIIKKGVKLDNLIQIAHNCEVGENTVIASQTGIAGSTKIGKNCMFGGQVGVTGHIRIGDDVKIGAQSGIGKTIMNGETVMGSPAFELGIFQRSYVGIRKLPDLINRINDLERELKKLKNPTE